ncbi:hypothetical protein GDO86_020069 [Hymenochirus boettgeri]|uniref:TNFR-Cys domain-containing protein n=1 Tax=Hymenochirus boettgeri TaxID=247094 RepID=A0A8T2IIY4_9PIPI|nr:hypothetical protein GDO86_020069 [Hymenochirus boettgeri]
MEEPNKLSYCPKCRRCEGIFKYHMHCTPTSNAVCDCTKGRRCSGEKCERCASHICPEGQELNGQKCIDCAHGTFKPGVNGICKPWTSCSHGAAVMVNGTRVSDVLCRRKISPTTESFSEPPPTSPAIQTVRTHVDVNPVYLAITVSTLFSLGTLIILLPYFKKWMKKIKTELQKSKDWPNFL